MPVTAPAPGVPALELVDVSVQFGALRAVDSVSLAVGAGQRHALLGTNGAGKTTLFSTIAGEVWPLSGRVRVFGEDVTMLPPQERMRRGLGRTYQNPVLFSELTLRENLILAVRGAAEGGFSLRPLRSADTCVRRTEELARAAGLAHVIDAPVLALSHGQCKQLELAMALASGPRLLLLDEPAAGLAKEDRERLIRIIRDLPGSLTVVLIEHDMEVALSLADAVTVMKDGAVIASGSPAEISRSPVVQRIYLGHGFEEGGGHAH